MGTNYEGNPGMFSDENPMGSPGVHIHGGVWQTAKAAGVVFWSKLKWFFGECLKKLKQNGSPRSFWSSDFDACGTVTLSL